MTPVRAPRWVAFVAAAVALIVVNRFGPPGFVSAIVVLLTLYLLATHPGRVTELVTAIPRALSDLYRSTAPAGGAGGGGVSRP